MIRKNPFDGKSIYTKFVWCIYERLMRREWFTNSDVMADMLGNKSVKELSYSVSKCPNYGQLKKAFSNLKKFLEEKVGNDCIEMRGNNRNKEYRYVGGDDNPLENFQNASAINDIRVYAQFCEDSAGFFPSPWLEYFFEDTLDLLNIKQRKKNGRQMIFSSIDRELTNIHLLPLLYEAIRNKKVLSIEYNPRYKKNTTLEFHPHVLKEYNGRWFLFGYTEGKGLKIDNLALDRIIKEPTIVKNANKYRSAPKGFYNDYFKNIVGVTHNNNESPKAVIVRATQNKIFKLVETKKMHQSQETIKHYGKHEDGEYGEFRLFVEINDEFIGRILQMGDGLVVVAPTEVREKFKQRVMNMVTLYKE